MWSGRTRSSLLALALAVACGEPPGGEPPLPEGPYDDIPLAHDLRFDGLVGPVHVARDEYGVAHVHAESSHDLMFAVGYVMAHDRLPQMDILRRFGAGTVAELFGIDADAMESDLEMRVHRFRALSEQSWAVLQASTDPDDVEMVAALQAFADGVNAYNADVVAGAWTIDDRLLAVFDPARFAPWSPIDTLVLGKFQAFALSYTADFVIDATDIYQTARQVFAAGAADPALAARAGAAEDLLRLTPIDRIPTIDGFPNVGTDTGTRSNALPTARRPLIPSEGPAEQGPSRGTRATARLFRRALAAAPPIAPRPTVPRALLRDASRTRRPAKRFGPDGLFLPRSGSNNWVVGPQHAGGKALLAGDPHLSLPNPSIFYPMHLVIPGELDVEGSTFPGIPGVLHGTNGKVAWASTVVYHQVNDVYLETIAPCSAGGGDCVSYQGGEVPIETWTETFRVGSLGTIFDTVTFEYERVPHHGHIIPTIADRAVVPRTANQALSVRYTGHQVTHEVRFLWKLNRARDVGEAFAALSHFVYGGQNWVFIDDGDNIGWSTHVQVPVRDPAAHAWHPDNPDGLAPFLVLPGDGSAEWQGAMDPRYIPHAYNPPQGYLVTANSDPVGQTFDGDPLDEPVVDGRSLYLGAFYAAGLRTGRITRRLQALIGAGKTITADDMAAIQTDSHSNLGDRFTPLLGAVAGEIDGGARADVDAWLATLPPARVQRLRDAAARLGAWTYATPPAVEGSPPAAEIADSVATSVFNAWGHFFLGRALGDETARLDWNIYSIDDSLTIRVALALLEEPETFASGLLPATGDPILCDDLDTAEAESCALVALQALDEALDWAQSADGFDTADADDWRWGKLHTLTLEPLFPNRELDVPPPSDPNPDLRGGYPRAGDNFAVNRADCGWTNTNFSQDGSGPAQRMVAETTPDGIRIRVAIPGGTIYDPTSPHFRDLMDTYYIPNRQFAFPYTAAEIVARGEERWLIRSN